MMLFPLCGIDINHVTEVAATANNRREAAKRLGISERHFYGIIRDKGLGHLFRHKKPRQTCITEDDIRKLAAEGYILKDAAHIAGIGSDYMRKLLRRFNLDGIFPPSRQSRWIANHGYVDPDKIIPSTEAWRNHYERNKEEYNRKRRERNARNKMKSGLIASDQNKNYSTEANDSTEQWGGIPC